MAVCLLYRGDVVPKVCCKNFSIVETIKKEQQLINLIEYDFWISLQNIHHLDSGRECSNRSNQSAEEHSVCRLVPNRIQGQPDSKAKSKACKKNLSISPQVGINYQPPTVVPGGDLAKVHRWKNLD